MCAGLHVRPRGKRRGGAWGSIHISAAPYVRKSNKYICAKAHINLRAPQNISAAAHMCVGARVRYALALKCAAVNVCFRKKINLTKTDMSAAPYICAHPAPHMCPSL